MTYSSYQTAVLAAAPQLYWPLGSNPFDLSPNGHNGTAAGVTFGTGGPGGGLAASFPGLTTALVWATLAMTQNQPWSVEIWYQTTSAAAIGAYNYNQAPSAPTGTYTPAIYVSGGKLNGYLYAGSPANNITDPGNSNDGNWHYCALTYAGGTGPLVMFRDGAQVATQSGFTITLVSGGPVVGMDPAGGWPGALAHFAMYGYQLAPATIAAHYNAMLASPPAVVAPPVSLGAYCATPVTCTLSLGSNVLDLMNAGNGFRLNSLDVGFPTVREDVYTRPDQSGLLDYTRVFGARAVTIGGSVVRSPAGDRSVSLAALAAFLDPAVRPVLTYQWDHTSPARAMTLRAVGFTGPYTNPTATAFTAQWKAPTGIAKSAAVTSASCGSGATPGRTYNLTFPRAYPVATQPNYATCQSNGDYPASPLLRVYGPASGIRITWQDLTTGLGGTIALQAGYTVTAGHRLDITCAARTILLDGITNVYGSALGAIIAPWPTLTPGHRTRFSLNAGSVGPGTALVVQWQDAWLI